MSDQHVLFHRIADALERIADACERMSPPVDIEAELHDKCGYNAQAADTADTTDTADKTEVDIPF